jgi:hypothetical protein
MPPHVCPRQGLWRPRRVFSAASDVIDFALVTVCGLKNGSVFFPQQGRWRHAPRFCAASTSGVTTVQTRVRSGAPAAMLSASEFELDECKSPRGIYQPRCASAELLISCCGSFAALPALANCNGHVAKTNITRPRPPTLSALCTAPTAREV